MANILRIDSSVRGDASVTRHLLDRIEDRLAGTVVRRDLADSPLPVLSGTWAEANFTPAENRGPHHREALALSDDLIAELRAADVLLIGAPVYNFSIPSTLKAWIDLVARAGETFRYTEAGPEGLLEGKRAIVAFASGGTGIGSGIDYSTGYLRFILGFLGIDDVRFVAADRMGQTLDEALSEAEGQIDAVAA